MTTRCFTALAGAFGLLVLSLTAAGAADTAGPRAGEEINEGCAGIIATGTCVKGGRSIFWKQRHVAEAEGNKPYFFSGPVYDYTGIGSEANSTSRMGMNEAGLALGTFTASSPAMSEANRQYVSDMSMTTTEVCQHALGNFSTGTSRGSTIAGRPSTTGCTARASASTRTATGRRSTTSGRRSRRRETA
jgi:hypothetical protein